MGPKWSAAEDLERFAVHDENTRRTFCAVFAPAGIAMTVGSPCSIFTGRPLRALS
jgi:hypothetical protein